MTQPGQDGPLDLADFMPEGRHSYTVVFAPARQRSRVQRAGPDMQLSAYNTYLHVYRDAPWISFEWNEHGFHPASITVTDDETGTVVRFDGPHRVQVFSNWLARTTKENP